MLSASHAAVAMPLSRWTTIQSLSVIHQVRLMGQCCIARWHGASRLAREDCMSAYQTRIFEIVQLGNVRFEQNVSFSHIAVTSFYMITNTNNMIIYNSCICLKLQRISGNEKIFICHCSFCRNFGRKVERDAADEKNISIYSKLKQ